MATLKPGLVSLAPSRSLPALRTRPKSNTQSPSSRMRDDSSLGELYAGQRVKAAKSSMQRKGARLHEILRQGRTESQFFPPSGMPSQSCRGSVLLPSQAERPAQATRVLEQPKYVGQQANELTKFANAETILRHREESKLEQPTLRQILKVDDSISLQQMTKSQLNALPMDPTSVRNAPKLVVERDQIRHRDSYRLLVGYQ